MDYGNGRLGEAATHGGPVAPPTIEAADDPLFFFN